MRPRLDDPEALRGAVRDAVSLEMTLMLQYLYAAYSLPNLATGRRNVHEGLWTEATCAFVCGDGEERMDQGIRGTLLRVAREEMIHFLVANNLLMACGGEFYVATPQFGAGGRWPAEDLALERFGLDVAERFVRFEQPGNAVSELYAQIREALVRRPGLIVVEKGTTGGEHHLYLNERTNRRHPDYQLQVDDLASALFAIDFVTEQGEGAAADAPPGEASHHARMRDLRDRLGAMSPEERVRLAAPCVRNPSTVARPGTTLVTDPAARAVMEITNEAYEISMVLMIQHFGLRPRATLRRSPLMNAAIDLMTGVLRPVSAALVWMDAGLEGHTAGPSFELPGFLRFEPDHGALLRRLSDRLRALAHRADRTPQFPPVPALLLHEFSQTVLRLT